MSVRIKKFAVGMELGSSGVTFEVRSASAHLGDFRVSKGGIEWCKGRTHEGNGKTFKWARLIELLDQSED